MSCRKAATAATYVVRGEHPSPLVGATIGRPRTD